MKYKQLNINPELNINGNNKSIINVSSDSSINSGQSDQYHGQLRTIYNAKQGEDFSQIFNENAYNSIIFNYSLDKSLRKRDFVGRVTIDVNNPFELDVSIDELRTLVQLKFNNIFVNICKYNNVVMKNIKLHNGILSSVKFIVVFDEPVNHICLKKFVSQSLSKLSICFVDFEKLRFLKFFRFSKDHQGNYY